MTFRRPLGHKWFYPFGFCGLVVLAYVVATVGRRPSRLNVPIGILYLLVIASGLVATSWIIWTAKIVVDDVGVRWKEGQDIGDVRWNQIRSLVLDGGSLGLVKEGTAWTVKLPFVTRKLYETLAGRLNRLKPEEERILFP